MKVNLSGTFTFGLVSLTGTGIASLSQNYTIATMAAVASFFLLIIGSVLFVAKFVFLIYLQLKFARLPDKGVMCLI